jgi:hypothetical protein
MTVFSDTNRSNLRYLLESQWGQTPTSGTTRILRMTSHSLSTKKSTTMSNEIRADRMVSSVIETEMMSDGGINFEFSAGTYDDLFQAFVLGTWTRPCTFDQWTGSILAWTANNTIQITGADYTGYLTVGRRMTTRGWVNPSNNGFWQIASASVSGNVTTVTFTETSGVIEAGGVSAFLSDANDIIVLLNTSIRSGTSGAATFDSNGTNAFASAIAAGQLNVGQRIHVEGLGYETGTVVFSAAATAGLTITVSDGVNVVPFVAGTDFAVGSSGTTVAANLAAAVNAARVNGKLVGASTLYPQVYATASSGTVTFKDLNVTGGSLSKAADTGSVATVTNFASGVTSERGVFTITSVSSDVIGVTPAPGTNANAGTIPVTIRGSMLRNPGNYANIIPQSFSIEAGYTDVGLYFMQNGLRVNDFTLDVQASNIVTGTFNFMGKQTSTLNATQFGATPYIPLGQTNTESLNATTDVGSLTKNGVPLTTAVKQIKIDAKATLRNQMAVGSKFPVGIGTGRFTLSLTAQAYFATFDLYNTFLNHQTVAMEFSFQDDFGYTYFFTVPAMKLTADPIEAKGIDQDVMEELTFEAQIDPASDCMLQLDRFSSLLPV